MQNENLFDKIKETALHDLSGTDDFDPERIWVKSRRKEQRSKVWLWKFPVAASVLFVLGLAFWISARQNIDLPAGSVTKIAKVPDNADTKPKKEFARQFEADKRLPVQPALHSNVSKQIGGNRDYSYALKDSLITNAPVAKAVHIDTASVTSRLADMENLRPQNADLSDTATSANPLAPVRERVLTADISLPSDKTEHVSTLTQIFEQVKIDRMMRKKRLQFSRHYPKNGLWSFVHHSFKEYPSPRN
ncbi:hypothetical protein [Dyadobacter sp. Leaf189]|uniref:hypothetical protein n=1 Tax=Dyadobacter sp. Leaf189 TaxID=1736295 RepID=UPI0006F6A386|nr:hypothetical protein [Dyadobacter sp. Leaf189]KQS28217.1 hypothetical protein ASG33_17725 [Dyadobacter sp. Leaf189]